MGNARQVDEHGNVLSETFSTNNMTVSFTRKISDGDYGSIELFISKQVDVDPDADLVEVERATKSNLAFIKAIAFDELGIEYTADDGKVVEKPKATAQKTSLPKAGGSRGGGQRRSGGGATDKTVLWQEWVDDPDAFYDNRDKKESGEYSAKSPDFKHKKSGDGLWIDKAPTFAKLVLDGDTA